MKCDGVLLDHNYAGFRDVLARAVDELELRLYLMDIGAKLLTFEDLSIPTDMDDESLLQLCRERRLVLFTDNRNANGDDSLGSVLQSSVINFELPVLTPGQKRRAMTDRDYQLRLARSVVHILTGIDWYSEYLGVGRIYIPLPEHLK